MTGLNRMLAICSRESTPVLKPPSVSMMAILLPELHGSCDDELGVSR